MKGNKSPGEAKRAKKDEFYTRLQDIERELSRYSPQFEGKVVLCNCNDPRVSNFFKRFMLFFGALKLKRLIATCCKSQNNGLFSERKAERVVYMDVTADDVGASQRMRKPASASQ